MKLDSKQKVLLPIIILAFIFIGWQVFDMLSSSKNNDDTGNAANSKVTVDQKQEISTAAVASSAPPKEVNVANNAITSTTPSVSVNNTSNPEQQVQPDGAQQQPGQSPQFVKPEQKTVNDIEDSDDGSRSESYGLMKEYEKLQSQEVLLREKLTIAETRKKIADLNSKIAAIEGSGDGVNGISDNNKKEVTYKLVYIDYQGDKWAATLSDQAGNNLQEVAVGTKLADGTRVASINAKGVTVVRDDKRMLLTFSGSVPLGMMGSEETSYEKVYAKPVVTKKTTKTKKAVPVKPKKTVIPVKAVKYTKPVTAPKQQQKVQQVKQLTVSTVPAGKSDNSQVPTVAGASGVSVGAQSASEAKQQPVMQLKGTAPVAVMQITGSSAGSASMPVPQQTQQMQGMQQDNQNQQLVQTEPKVTTQVDAPSAEMVSKSAANNFENKMSAQPMQTTKPIPLEVQQPAVAPQVSPVVKKQSEQPVSVLPQQPATVSRNNNQSPLVLNPEQYNN